MLSILYFKNPNKIVNLIFEVIIFFPWPGKMAKNQSVFHQQKTLHQYYLISDIQILLLVENIRDRAYQLFHQQKSIFFYQQKLCMDTQSMDILKLFKLFFLLVEVQILLLVENICDRTLRLVETHILLLLVETRCSSTSRKHMQRNFSISRNPYSSTSRNSLLDTQSTEIFDPF